MRSMPVDEPEIARREFKHRKVAYGFQWNKTHHKAHGCTEGDLASLWAHLTTIARGQIPETPFRDPFFFRASRLRLKKMSLPGKVAFRKKLLSSGLVRRIVDSELIELTRKYHRLRNDLSYCADHSILSEFIVHDPKTIAIEVPVWSDLYRLSGHVDLIRFHNGAIEVCDYKPGPLESIKTRFLGSIPQVAAYGELIAHHLSSTLREALSAPFLPKVNCCIFDTHSCWHFGAEMFITLLESNNLDDFYV